jgi:hypothetical protein
MVNILTLNTDGSFQEVAPITTSAGASSAGKIPALNGSGVFDISMMPTGIGSDTQSIVASESLSAGDFVNIYNNTGVVNCRKALAADNTKPAHGFVLSAVSALATATVYVHGINSAVPIGAFVVANEGSKAFLSPTTAGAATMTIPATTGQVAQILGSVDYVGASVVSINFSEHSSVVRA